MRYSTLLVFLATIGWAAEQQSLHDIVVWADEPIAEKEYPEGNIIYGPCGPMRILQAESLNKLSERDFQRLERVLEFDENGEVVAEWRIPVESSVAQISSDWLMVSSMGGFIQISQSGDILPIEEPKTKSTMEHLGNCPDSVLREFLGESGESAYLRCWKLEDASSGKTRMLAFEGVCT